MILAERRVETVMKGMSLSLVIAGMLLVICGIAKCNPNVTLVDKACKGGKYKSEDKYAVAMGYVLEDLKRSTSEHGFSYECKHEYLGVWSYGHGACYGGLSKDDCVQCVDKAKGSVLELCANRMGGWVQLQDCRIRYDKKSIHE